MVHENSLGFLNPELAQEIDQEKSPVDPFTIVSGSSKVLWWRCAMGHSYSAPVIRRRNGSGCRFCSKQTSLPEIRVYAELEAALGGCTNRAKLNGREVDVLIEKHRLAIEYDGAYFHGERTAEDEKKAGLIAKAGFQLIRLREKPLTCFKNDISVSSGKDCPTKADLNRLLIQIGRVRPQLKTICDQYIERPSFLGEQEYRRIVSHLPGPPPGDTLADIHPNLVNEWNFAKTPH